MGKSSVRPELAKKIRDTARELGYIPNSSAKALVSGRQNVIGVFFAGHAEQESGLVEAFIAGVASELSKHHLRMMVQFFHDERDFEQCLAASHKNIVDGIVVGGGRFFDIRPKLEEVLARNVPVATMFSLPVSDEIPNVGIDQSEVGRVATQHLIEMGCRRPAFIRASVPEGVLRFRGYKKALEDAGLPFRDELVCMQRTYGVVNIPALLKKMINAEVDFDGIVAESDRQAAATYKALTEAGLSVPENVRLIGVNDSPFCPHFPVPLSSVSGQDRKRASMAVRLLGEVASGKPARHLTVPPVVAVRESTAAKNS